MYLQLADLESEIEAHVPDDVNTRMERCDVRATAEIH